MSIPEPTVKELKLLEQTLFSYVWNNTRDRNSRSHLVQTYANGGLNMIHIKSFIKSMKLSWMKRLLSGHSSWSQLVFDTMPDNFNLIFTLGEAFITEMKVNTTNIFWKEVLTDLSSFQQV